MRGQSLQLDFTDWRCQAEVYRLGFISGYFTKNEVIAWADGVIAQEDSPEQAIINISLGRTLNKQNLAHLLKKLSGEAYIAQAFKILLGLYATLLKNGNMSGSSVAYRLYSTLPASEEMLLDPNEDAVAVDNFHSSYILAQNGVYRTVEEVDKRFATFLEQYEPLADIFLECVTNQIRSAYEAETQNGHGRRRA